MGEFHVLPVPGCEVLLGAAWIKKLGDITWNFKLMKMCFTVDDKEVNLQGLIYQTTKLVSCNTMTKLLQKESEAMVFQLYPMETSGAETSADPTLLALLAKYSDIFQVPTKLPPQATRS